MYIAWYVMAANVDGLLLCWNSITVSPELQPIEKLMMKLIIVAYKYPSARYWLIAICR